MSSRFLRAVFCLLAACLVTQVTSEEDGLPVEEAAAAAVQQGEAAAEVALPLSSEQSVDAIGAVGSAVVAQPQKVEVAEEDVDALFTKADIDTNEQLSRTEFKAWWLDHKAHKEDFIDFHDKRDPNGVMIPRSFRDSVSMSEQRTVDFWTAFVNSLAMILVTELGDKTFFIAAVLAMRHPTCIIFSGAISALAIMTVLSAAIGFALPSLMPRQYTHYAATALFVYFGLKLVKEGCEMVAKGEGTGPSDELEEVELELKDKHEDDAEAAGKSRCSGGKKGASHGAIFWQALTLTFLAEWGDRSQIATIALASAKDPFGVTVGGILGHSMCTGLAVVGGKVVAGRISERNVLIVGGLLFLAFAVHAVIAGPGE